LVKLCDVIRYLHTYVSPALPVKQHHKHFAIVRVMTTFYAPSAAILVCFVSNADRTNRTFTNRTLWLTKVDIWVTRRETRYRFTIVLLYHIMWIKLEKSFFSIFLPRDAMLVQYNPMALCPSVCWSQSEFC